MAGAGDTGARRRRAEHGSQTLELAATIPVIVLLLVLLVHTALFAVDLVTAHSVAREAARAAAIGDDTAARDLAQAAVGRREVDVTITPAQPGRRAGDLVTAEVVLHSRAFAPFVPRTEATGRATMRAEAP